jgi:hypothetical protein
MTYLARCTRRLRTALLAAIALTAVLAGAGPVAGASVATCQHLTGVQPPSPGSSENELNSVAVLSACNVWAVGMTSDGSMRQTLIVHWDGKNWKRVRSPNPGATFNVLYSVRALSPTSIWAVGFASSGTGDKTVVLHWDGRLWRQVASPTPGGLAAELRSVRVVSATNIWAAGFWLGAHGERTLILHWDGANWTQQFTPNPGVSNELFGIAATSATNAWAVGQDVRASNDIRTLILHWDGTAWRRVRSPNPGLTNDLQAVGAMSKTNAWATGSLSAGGTKQTLILHWNGRTWAKVASPNPGGDARNNTLLGFAATSASNAWAAGGSSDAISGRSQTLLLHWNGKKWARMASPNPGTAPGSNLAAVSARSSEVWSAGTFHTGGGVEQALAIHCC